MKLLHNYKSLILTAFVIHFGLTGKGANPSVDLNNSRIQDSLEQVALREIVISENRLSTRFGTQNRNVTILDRAQIEAAPARSLNELLMLLPGVDLRQRGPTGSQADISIDGGSFEQNLILVDGVKMLDAQTAHHALNLPIPLNAIERIEIVRGSAARIYGINSLSGAINIVTKKTVDRQLSAHIYAGTGFNKAPDSGRNNLYHGKGVQLHAGLGKNPKQSHALFASLDWSNGHRYNTAFENYRVLYKGAIQTGEQNNLNLMAGFVRADFGANGFYAAPGDKESAEIVRTQVLSADHKFIISDQFSLFPRISYRYTDDDYRYFRYELNRARSRHYNQSLQPEIHGTYYSSIGDWGLGLEMRHEQIQSSNIGEHSRNNYGAYFEYRLPASASSPFSLSTGVYANFNSDYGWQWFPGIDLGYSLTNTLRLTAHAGTGQRIPSFTDLYLNQRPGNIGNPHVQPEESWHLDAGLKFEKNAWRSEFHVFYRNITNFIDWVYVLPGEPPYQPKNFDNNRVRGVSWNGQMRMWENPESSTWILALNFTYLDPSYAPQGEGNVDYKSKYAMDILRKQAQAQLIYTFRHRLKGSLGLRYQERISYRDYLLADARISYNWDRFEAYVDAQNITDHTYTEVGAAPLPGRWFTFGMKFNW